MKTLSAALLPWWEEDVEEGVLRHPSMDSGQALRMAFLFAMVSLSNHPPHLNPLPRRGEED
jgi:hypothetical protein